MSAELLSTTRNGIVERLEHGHCVLSDTKGSIVWALGNPAHITYLRSSAKPVQATALVNSGAPERFGLDSEHLAVSCGSHQGESRHVATVVSMLEKAGVPPEALQCGTHQPSWLPETLALARSHLTPTPLQNNCSGKHAGMLAAAQAMHAPLPSYLDEEHPVQRMIRENLAACAGVSPQDLYVGLDGCSAPNFALPMHAIARCFAQIGQPTDLSTDLHTALIRVGTAMRAHPWLVSGTAGLDTVLMQASSTLISKGGAEGLQCVALPHLGLGLAIKFESGRAERIGSLVIAILRSLGLFPEGTPPTLKAYDCPAVRNHRGTIVGETRLLVSGTDLPQVTSSVAQ